MCCCMILEMICKWCALDDDEVAHDEHVIYHE